MKEEQNENKTFMVLKRKGEERRGDMRIIKETRRDWRKGGRRRDEMQFDARRLQKRSIYHFSSITFWLHMINQS